MVDFFTNIKVGTRVYILSALMAIGMCVLIFISVSSISVLLTDAYRLNTETAVDMAYSVVEDFKAQSDAGILSEQEAQKTALDYVSKIRYDGDNYVWINDMAGIMLMHPTSPKLNGTDVREIKDADGKKLFSDMIVLLQKNDMAEYRYQWPPNETAKPKLSFVKRVKGWDWVLGTGVYIDKIQSDTMEETVKMGSAALIVLLIALVIALLIGRSISKPVQTITAIMRRLADGDLSVNIGMENRKDEIGAMAGTVRVFQENLKQVEKLKQEQEKADALAEAEKRKNMNDLADSFEASVGEIVNVVASASTEMQSNAKNLSDMSKQTSQQTTKVAAATEEASASVQTVAAAAEQLSASISEINRQIDQSSKIAENAVAEVRRTDDTVSTLSEAATEIGDVVKLIQDIAEQTNLLALNATIEAARAGEAGKGFAVVASEVKNLANQTGQATEDISNKIITIQGVAQDAVTAIRSIGSIIEQIDEITKGISSALGQQDEATKEISHNVQQASAGTKEISDNIVDVTHTAKESYDASTETLNAANELSTQSETLRYEITRFISTVRQG